jgi:hypothetical protein
MEIKNEAVILYLSDCLKKKPEGLDKFMLKVPDDGL